MEERNSKTYHCGYCKEYYLRKGAAVKHEAHCRNKPANRHVCWDCAHLERYKENIEEPFCDRPITMFRCKAKNIMLYSYIAERRDMVNRLEFEFEGIERMPLECSEYTLDLPF